MTISTGFLFQNYKSFEHSGAKVDEIKPVNLVVGKNNIGKSSLIDVIEYLAESSLDKPELNGKVILTDTLEEGLLRNIFSENSSGGTLGGNHWHQHGARFVGARMSWRYSPGASEMLPSDGVSHHELRYLTNGIVRREPFKIQKTHIRLGADRDLIAERPAATPSISSNGAGATNVIQLYINHSNRDRAVIQTQLLVALNEIFNPDIRFSEIIVQFHPGDENWEVFLAEEGKKPYPLSASGSGLKTVMLTLLNLVVRPDFERKSLQDYIFSLEELENNLHPALQRNLFAFLLRFAVKHNCHLFLTTHSQVAIDLYHDEKNAQIIHVRKERGEVVGSVLNEFRHGYNVLDDIGAKASDILQANGIIWVEGPSDRVFLNKFIEVWGKGAYKEGLHYQFVFYGGSVLANIDASVPEGEIKDAINAFRINRNFIFVCDSDRAHKGGSLKKRVTDLLQQVGSETSRVWVTRCREIENYIPSAAFDAVHGENGLPQIGEYQFIQDYLMSNKLSKAKEYTGKHHKAVQYAEHFTLENLSFRPELDQEITKIVDMLHAWNT